MNQKAFDFLSTLIYQESGIVLPPEKALLLGNRVQKRLRALGLSSEGDYLKTLENDKTGEEIVHLIDVVSTNVTYFYREPRHFEIYGQLLKQFRSENRSDIKVWCAAASSGQEPFTLAMETALNADLSRQTVKILGTDICTTVLQRATKGIYSEKEMEKTPPDRTARFFDKLGGEDPCWRVKPEISKLVLFKKLNLVQFPFPLKGPVDIIFCRNVMIYFDTPTRAKIIQQFEGLLRKGGYLFLSHSENLLGINHGLKRFDSSVFIKS